MALAVDAGANGTVHPTDFRLSTQGRSAGRGFVAPPSSTGAEYQEVTIVGQNESPPAALQVCRSMSAGTGGQAASRRGPDTRCAWRADKADYTPGRKK